MNRFLTPGVRSDAFLPKEKRPKHFGEECIVALWIVTSGRYCVHCKRRWKLREMRIGREPIPDGERIFFICPNCGEEIPYIPVHIENQTPNMCE